MKISILLGTVRKERQSHKVAHHLAETLKNRGIETHLIDLAKLPLPVHGTEDGADPALRKNIRQTSSQLDEADALIFVTPEYHGSFSGVLKNALDYFWKEFYKKPIGVVATSAGKMAGINASTQLQHVILSLGAFPVPLKLLVPEIHHAFDESFEPLREDVVRNTDKFLDEFLWFADAISVAKRQTKERAA